MKFTNSFFERVNVGTCKRDLEFLQTKNWMLRNCDQIMKRDSLNSFLFPIFLSSCLAILHQSLPSCLAILHQFLNSCLAILRQFLPYCLVLCRFMSSCLYYPSPVPVFLPSYPTPVSPFLPSYPTPVPDFLPSYPTPVSSLLPSPMSVHVFLPILSYTSSYLPA